MNLYFGHGGVGMISVFVECGCSYVLYRLCFDSTTEEERYVCAICEVCMEPDEKGYRGDYTRSDHWRDPGPPPKRRLLHIGDPDGKGRLVSRVIDATTDSVQGTHGSEEESDDGNVIIFPCEEQTARESRSNRRTRKKRSKRADKRGRGRRR